jgi:hypothetical protein
MTDLNFVAAFADNPITLAILVVGATAIVLILKGGPIIKEFRDGNNLICEKIDTIVESDKKQTEAIDDIREHLKMNNLDVLRMTIYNDGVDIEDRLVAAKRYFVRGGNGKVADYVKLLVEQHPSVWKIVLATTSKDKHELLPVELRSV